MLFSWYIRWLYPASSEPPPLDAIPDLGWDGEWQMPFFREWTPPWNDQPQEPQPNPDVPFFQSSWTMVFGTWFAYALYTEVVVEEQEDPYFLDSEKPMPEYPVWLPPVEPSYFNDEQEQPHPEVDRIDLPIWLPWRPIPHLDYFNELPEDVGPDKFESPWQIPRGVYFMPAWWDQLEEEPPEELEYLDQMHILPVPPPYFMPPHLDFFEPTPHAPKCPPPCLRRPDRKC